MENTINRETARGFLSRHRYAILLFLIGLFSFTMNFYAIQKVGTGNEYYAAAIKSMTQSFHNFFYVSFDPVGISSVDKPPLGLWVQAIFVLIFGYHGWAMLLPQALAGAGSTLLLYALTAKHFGKPAGILSSLIFAVTPAVVVASRNNTMDMQLIFVLLLAAWFLFKSIESGKWKYLFVASILIGLGFNIKMLQAYMILPACALTYLLFAKEKLSKRFLAGLISLVIVAAVSFAWVVAVDLTPAANRPYVGSSTNNTVMELIVGHNGLERIYGQSMGGGNGAGGGFTRGGTGDDGRFRQDGTTSDASTQQSDSNGTAAQDGSVQQPGNNGTTGTQDGNTQPFSGMPNNNGGTQDGNTQPGTPPSGNFGDGSSANGGFSGGGMQNAGGGIGSSEIGTASLFRLFSSNLYGQISWLLVMAIFGSVASFRKFSLKSPKLKSGIWFFWVLWLVTMFVFFSFAGFYHRYYLCMMAPAIAVLSGIGIIRMFKEFAEKSSWRRFLLPASLLVTLVIQVIYVWSYTALRAWLVPVMVGFGVLALVLMLLHLFKPKRLLLPAAAVCLVLSILAAPFYWALTPILYVPNSTLPYAGPELASQGAGGTFSGRTAGRSNSDSSTNEAGSGSSTNDGTNAGMDSQTSSSGLEQYLVEHYKEGSYLVVSQRASDVAQFIIDTGLPAVAYGGFLGSDNALTLDQLKALVAEGKITYFLVSGQGGGSGSSDLESYVTQNATLIDSSEYGSSSGGSGSLYLFQ